MNELYVDGSRKGGKGKIAVTDLYGKQLVVQLFYYPCCQERVEIAAIVAGYDFLENNGREGIIHSDNEGAIKHFTKYLGTRAPNSDIRVVHIDGKNNKADSFSKLTKSDLEMFVEERLSHCPNRHKDES